MATVRKRKNGKWICEVRRAPDFYKAKQFGNKHDALEWGINIERQLELHPDKPTGYTIRHAIERYLEEETPKKKGAKQEGHSLRRLLGSKLADVTLDDAESRDFQRWIDNRAEEVSGDSVRREFATLRTVLRKAKRKWRWTKNESFKDVELPKSNPSRDRIATDAEIERIMEALFYEGGKAKNNRHEIALAVILAIETAMRQGEIWGLSWKDINLKGRFVTLRDTKNNDSRNVPLSNKALEAIECFPSREGRLFSIQQGSGEAIFRRAVRLAGIEGLRFHDLRHTAVTRLAKKLDVLDLARMIGHRDLRSLQIYYNPTASEIAKKLD